MILKLKILMNNKIVDIKSDRIQLCWNIHISVNYPIKLINSTLKKKKNTVFLFSPHSTLIGPLWVLCCRTGAE